MSLADDVRNYCLENIIEPARLKGDNEISIRAGDIHTAMGYHNRMPLVCSSLGTKKFEELANVHRVSITGPANGANAVFTFRFLNKK